VQARHLRGDVRDGDGQPLKERVEMAREKEKHASLRPSQATKGGGFGFPPGATVTITEASFVPAEEIGEKFVGGGRGPEDPVLKLVGDVEGADEPVEEVLGCGKQLRASKDNEFLAIPDGVNVNSLNDNSNGFIFLNTVFYDPTNKKGSEAYKRHKDKALNEELLDDGITSAIVGLKFVAGREVHERNFDDGGQRKARPSLVCDEILKAPKGAGKSARAADEDEDEERPAKSTKRAARDEDEDEEETPRKTKGKGNSKDEDDADAATEKLILEALEQPKYRKGLPVDKVFTVVHNMSKELDNKKDIMELAEDEEWVKAKARPWAYDKEDDILEAV